ncbi:uncharacterized protein LOC127097578 isoform X3 [Lathyrus oleraceus]|uniref:uncharacterized protein LOC127097578 isoform X3 n=1 Tax=Pisum sativum TaxID=3888 RepID=UPI0021CF9196|nr:uncharacterized protein LOC127097578 isoform X3 [Pisum sativum]XP_050892033.1 uncharacterized protein LOC127097578 isoform X3 [Pisum sativum]XP_050892034.1 uncharacterized protein LOC127097578 isoform X3 [Pisum sativum]
MFGSVKTWSCTKEVTPVIYDIFKGSYWWNVYHCSVSSEKAHSRSYFCMLLSKLPVKSFSTKSFSNSIMGRELCIAEVEDVSGKSLVVVPGHIESPSLAPAKWDQMFTKERLDQANEDLNILKRVLRRSPSTSVRSTTFPPSTNQR